MASINPGRRLCGYRRQGQEYDVTYVHEDYARRLVLGGHLSEALALHARGEMSVCPVLEYAAKRGKHPITQALLAAGVTVTRAAIQAAAKLGGTGVDLLLAGIREGDALAQAQRDALHAQLFYGEFRRATELMEAGVSPDDECYDALELGCKREGRAQWEMRAEPLLDAMISRTPLEAFTQRSLQVILLAARPIHIERVLERLEQPPMFLYVTALACNAQPAIETLRHLGLRMTDDVFQHVCAELCSRRFIGGLRWQSLFDLYFEDRGPAMTAQLAEPLLVKLLDDQQYALHRIGAADEDAYERVRQFLRPIVRCVEPSEYSHLCAVVDGWASRSLRNSPTSPSVRAVLKHVLPPVRQIPAAQLADSTPNP